MTSRKKTVAVGGGGKAQPPAPELTADEITWARLYFSAMRRVEQSMADEANGTFLRAAAHLADEHPRHKRPALRLVSGGAK